MKATYFRDLLSLFRPFRGAFVLLIAFGFLASLAEGFGIGLLVPLIASLNGSLSFGESNFFLRTEVSQLLEGLRRSQQVLILAACVLSAIALRSALFFAHSILSRWVDSRITHKLRVDLFERLLQMPFRGFESSPTGTLVNVLTSETWRTSQAVATLLHVIVTACILSVYTILLLAISWKLTLIVAFALAINGLLVRYATRGLRELGIEFSRLNARLQSQLIACIEGMKTVRLFGQERREQRIFDDTSMSISKLIFKMYRIGDTVTPLYEMFAATAVIAMLLASLYTGTSLPAALVFVFVLHRVQPKVMGLHGALTQLASLENAVNEVQGVLRRDSVPASGSLRFTGLKQDIRFDDVAFRYGSTSHALQGITVRIPARSFVALVGPSGAGKSTLVKLLLRLYEPTAGDIEVDGVPLQEYGSDDWLRDIGFVAQDPYLFDLTVAENIAYGSPDASFDDIHAAAELAHADEFIDRLPQGYDTPVGERGCRLSGGEQQRIALARAIVRKPDILVLDEPTNSLDPISEEAIHSALALLKGSCTIIVIAHRLSTIELADHIFVLENGNIREKGSAIELARQNGLFRRLFHPSALSGAVPEQPPGKRQQEELLVGATKSHN